MSNRDLRMLGRCLLVMGSILWYFHRTQGIGWGWWVVFDLAAFAALVLALRCPRCGQFFAGGSICSRCGADLTGKQE